MRIILAGALGVLGAGSARAQEPPTSLLPPSLGQPAPGGQVYTPPAPGGQVFTQPLPSAGPPAYGAPPAYGVPAQGQPYPAQGQPYPGQGSSYSPPAAPYPQPAAPYPAPQGGTFGAPPPAEPGGSQILGTLPVPGPVSGPGLGPVPGDPMSGAAVPGAEMAGGPGAGPSPQALVAAGEVLSRLSAPLPASPLQRAARDLLREREIVAGSDPVARAGALYALGFAEDAAGAAVETQAADVAGRALTARALLAVGQREQACIRADVDELPKDAQPGPTLELLEVLTLCKLEQGSAEAAALIAGLLREQGGGDALFFALFDLASGKTASLPEAKDVASLRPIHLALARRAGTRLDASYVAKADLALLPLIARQDGIDIETHLSAVERMVEGGIAQGSDLAGLYLTTPLDERLLGEVAGGSAPVGPLARAHLYALLAEARDDGERVRFIAEIYRQAFGAGVSGAIAELLGEDVAGIAPAAGLGQASPMMVEILARADRAQAAVGWIDAGEIPGPDGRSALSRMMAHRNRALVAVLTPELGIGAAAGALGADAGGGAVSPAGRSFIAAEVAVMAALGDPISPILTEIAGPAAPPPAPAGALGALAALAQLGSGPLAAAEPRAVAAGVAALAGVGKTVEARRLAAEALALRPVE